MLQKILDAAEKKRLSQAALESAAALAKGRISKWKAAQGDPSWLRSSGSQGWLTYRLITSPTTPLTSHRLNRLKTWTGK